MDAQGAGRAIVFQMPQIPGLLFPPPPPPPQILSYSSSYTSSSSHHPSSITSFPILLLTVLGILTTSVLLLTYYVFVIRCCLNWHDSNVAGLIVRSRRRDGGTVASSSTLPGTGTPSEARGLEESTIRALPTFRYRKAIKSAAADSAPTSECAVCLSEFEEEDRVRMLPSCLHAFHVDCIDTWLQGNANCPLCRAAITGHCIIPLDQLQQPEEVVIQVATPTEVAEETQDQQQQASTAAAESGGDTTTAQQVSRNKRNNAWRDVEISSKEDEWAAVKKDRDVLPLRRSSSMVSLGGEEVRLQIQNILQRNVHFHRDDTGSASGSSSTV